jgi:hypothetical protein
LGAQRRTFNFAGDLVQALGPLGLSADFLHHLEDELHEGRSVLIEATEEQDAAIGVLPVRNGFQWVRITVYRTVLGDGSFRYSVSSHCGARGLNELCQLERNDTRREIDARTPCRGIRTGACPPTD